MDWLAISLSEIYSGCSTVVVYALWEREIRVRFSAPRPEVFFQKFLLTDFLFPFILIFMERFSSFAYWFTRLREGTLRVE